MIDRCPTCQRAMPRPLPKRRRARRGPLRDPHYRRYCKRQPCVICGHGPSDAAHTQNNGLSSKGPDSSCVSLCRIHHLQYDAGRNAFEKRHAIDMAKVARESYNRYQIEKLGRAA